MDGGHQEARGDTQATAAHGPYQPATEAPSAHGAGDAGRGARTTRPIETRRAASRPFSLWQLPAATGGGGFLLHTTDYRRVASADFYSDAGLLIANKRRLSLIFPCFKQVNSTTAHYRSSRTGSSDVNKACS